MPRFTQKITLIAVPMILLGAAIYITNSIANRSGYRAGYDRGRGEFHVLEETGSSDSPIIVGNGSVHVRQKEGKIHQVDGANAVVDLLGHVAVSVSDYSCAKDNSTASVDANCTLISTTKLAAPWQIQLQRANGSKVVGTIGTLIQANGDFPGLLAFSAIPAEHPHTISSDPDNGGDGTGFKEDCAQCTSDHAPMPNLSSASITNNGPNPTVPKALCSGISSGQNCMLKISYCDASAIATGNCSN
jgi:hypothetical protein